MLTASHVMMPTAMTTASQIMFRFDTLVTFLSTVNVDVRTTNAANRGWSAPCGADGRPLSTHKVVGDLVVDHPDVEITALGHPSGHSVCPHHECADVIAGSGGDHADEALSPRHR